MSKIIDFYFGRAVNQDGDTINEILKYDNERLEDSHHYIQWLFPLDEPSRAVPGSPVLTDQDLKDWKNAPLCSQRMLNESLPLMLRFYGLEITDGQMVIQATNFNVRSQHWMHPGDHNHLRLTRMMKSLKLLGMPDIAKQLQDCLLSLTKQYPSAFHSRTIHFWQTCIMPKH